MTATGYRYIDKIPNVKGGNAIVEGTRLCVHTVVFCMQRGDSLNEIIGDYPFLTRAQIYECMAYYEDYKDEIEALITLHQDSPTQDDLRLMAAIRERNAERRAASGALPE